VLTPKPSVPPEEKKPEDLTPETAKPTTPSAANQAAEKPETTVPAEAPKRKRRTLLWVFFLLLLVGGGIGAWLIFGRSGTRSVSKTATKGYGPRHAPLTYWLVVGPFPAKDGRDLGKVYPPEHAGHKLTSTFKGSKGPLKWKLVKARRNTVDLIGDLGTHTNCSGYGLTFVECPANTKARLGIGSDDGVQVWLNGKQVHKNAVPRSCVPDQDIVPVTLKKGVNEIFIKVAQGTGQWAFAVTIKDPKGKALSGLNGRLPKRIKIPGTAKPKKPVNPAKTAPPKKR
jgi:hypothetical protein